ncbi:hypothetical protein D3C71_1613490 [compost metagenome]
MGDISQNIKEDTRAIMILCFTYDAVEFIPPHNGEYSNKILNASLEAKQRGMENWQVNLKFDEFGVELIRYFRLNL